MAEKTERVTHIQDDAKETEEEETASVIEDTATSEQEALTGGAAAGGSGGLTGGGPDALTGGAEVDVGKTEASQDREESVESNEEVERALSGTEAEPAQIPRQVLGVLSQGGKPLDEDVRGELEQRLDADFSDVRIHTGGRAALAADALDARAFTCGNDIIFNAGEYNPATPEGQYLLAHELAHVKQQDGSAMSMLPKEDVELEVDPDQELEREADEAAENAMADEEPVTVNRMGSEVEIQRAAKGESMAYQGLDSLTEEVNDLKDQVEDNEQAIDETQSDLGDLEDDVHSGLGEKATAVAGGSVAAGAVAFGRAASEPALQETFAESMVNPELAAPALAATAVTGGVAALGAGVKQTVDSIRNRLSGADDDAQGQRIEEEEEDEDGLLNKVGL